MNRKIITVLLLMLTGVSTLSGCSTTAIHHDHGYDSGYYSEYYYSPPPLAPVHGYRHYYHGHDLVYDSYLGVYIVLGEVNHYYYRGNYYRYDDHNKHWYCRSGFNKNWYAYDHRTPLPAGLVKKHTKHVNIQGRHQETVKDDYRKGDNRRRDNSLQGRPGLRYHENRYNTAIDRDNRGRNNNHGGYIQPQHERDIQPKYSGHIQPTRNHDKDSKRNEHSNPGDSGRGINGKSRLGVNTGNQDDRPGRGGYEKKQENRKKSNNREGVDIGHPNLVINGKSRLGVNTGNQDDRPGRGRNELKQGNKKQSNHRASINRVNQGKRDKAQQRTNVGSNAEKSRKNSSESHDAGDHDQSGKSISKRHDSKKWYGSASAKPDRHR